VAAGNAPVQESALRNRAGQTHLKTSGIAQFEYELCFSGNISAKFFFASLRLCFYTLIQQRQTSDYLRFLDDDAILF